MLSSTTERRPTAFRYSEADLPTEYGVFRIVVYRQHHSDVEHMALVKGEVADQTDVLVRVHSECFTGEVLHSLKCDCREQLDLAMRRVAEAGSGAVLYLRQEGRGIGLGNKVRAYSLQQRGFDTVDANRALGFEDDLRRYEVATDMLRDLGIRSVALMTNNPRKVQALSEDGVRVSQRLDHHIEPNEHNHGYLVTKQSRMGHFQSEPERSGPSAGNGAEAPLVWSEGANASCGDEPDAAE